MATFSLFREMKLIMGMLFLLGVVFCIISLYVNIVATNDSLDYQINNLPIFLSNWTLVNNTNNSTASTLLSLSPFLLILTVTTWWLWMFIHLCLSQKYHRIVDQAQLSPADFSILL